MVLRFIYRAFHVTKIFRYKIRIHIKMITDWQHWLWVKIRKDTKLFKHSNLIGIF